MSNRAPKFKPTANPALAKGLREIASSGKSGSHLDGRLRRARTRLAARRVAVEDQRVR